MSRRLQRSCFAGWEHKHVFLDTVKICKPYSCFFVIIRKLQHLAKLKMVCSFSFQSLIFTESDSTDICTLSHILLSKRCSKSDEPKQQNPVLFPVVFKLQAATGQTPQQECESLTWALCVVHQGSLWSPSTVYWCEQSFGGHRVWSL